MSSHSLSAVDANTVIYTLVTGGNDNKIKIWRIFSIANGKLNRRTSNAGASGENRLNSRLVPTTMQQHFAETATIFPTLYLNAECVHSFEAHGSSVTAVRFNSKSTLLVSGGLDRMVKIWNMQGSCLKTLDEHGSS
jgi:WD40 repeat protein